MLISPVRSLGAVRRVGEALGWEDAVERGAGGGGREGDDPRRSSRRSSTLRRRFALSPSSPSSHSRSLARCFLRILSRAQGDDNSTTLQGGVGGMDHAASERADAVDSEGEEGRGARAVAVAVGGENDAELGSGGRGEKVSRKGARAVANVSVEPRTGQRRAVSENVLGSGEKRRVQ